MTEKIRYKDLSIWLKIPISLIWAYIGILIMSFIVAFGIGMTGG